MTSRRRPKPVLGRGGSGIVPQRTCIGCRRTQPADDLVRVVRLEDGSLASGRALPGRGAWLCRGSVACVDSAGRRQAFPRALRGPVGDRAVDRLKQEFGFATGDPDRTGRESPVA